MSTYATLASPTFTGTVTLPNSQQVTSSTGNFLTSATLGSSYVTAASPTVTGNITLPTTLVTPTAGQLGHTINGTIALYDSTRTLVNSPYSMTALAVYQLSTLSLPIGVWLVLAQASVNAVSANYSISNFIASVTTNSTVALDSTSNVTTSVWNTSNSAITLQSMQLFNFSTTTSIYLYIRVNPNTTVVQCSGTNCFFKAVRIA